MSKRKNAPLFFCVTFERHGVTYSGACEGVTARGFYVTRADGLLFFVAPQELRYA